MAARGPLPAAAHPFLGGGEVPRPARSPDEGRSSLRPHPQAGATPVARLPPPVSSTPTRHPRGSDAMASAMRRHPLGRRSPLRPQPRPRCAARLEPRPRCANGPDSDPCGWPVRGRISCETDGRGPLDLSPSHRANKQTHRASGKAKKCGEATQQKAHEAPHLRDSYHAGTISGFSPSFKNRYYGELVTNSQSHPVGNRTPRIPVLAPTDRSATDDATSELKNAICSTKRNNDRVSNDCANFSINEFSLDGRSRIMESTKGVEYQTFLTKGTGDTDIFQNQQPLKRKGMDQIMDRGQTSTAGHETLMEVREGNKPVGLLKAEQMFDEYISSDDMLILNVFQSLVSAADKMSKVKINFPSGTLRSETTLSDTDRKDEGISLVDVSKHGKPVDECSAYKANKKKHTELLDAEESCMPLY